MSALSRGTSTHTNPGGAAPGGVGGGLADIAHVAARSCSRLDDVSKYQTALTKPSTDMAISPYSRDVGTWDMGEVSVMRRCDASAVCDREFQELDAGADCRQLLIGCAVVVVTFLSAFVVLR